MKLLTIIIPLVIIQCSSMNNEKKITAVKRNQSVPHKGVSSTVIESSESSGYKNTEYIKKLTVKGLFTVSFEYCGIQPCDSSEAWWVEANPEVFNRYNLLMNQMGIDSLKGGSKYHPTAVFCIFDGQLSKKGHYGHMGGCKYKLKVDKIIKMSIPTDNDCEN